MSGATRQRRLRQRQRDGLAIFKVEASVFALADALVDAGWLQAWDSDSHAAIQLALDRAVHHLVAGE